MFIEPEDKEKQNQVNTPSIGAGAGAAGGASPSTGMPSTTIAVQPQQPEQKFASVQDYLKTNQPQGEEMANKFVSGLQSTAEQEKGAIGNAAQGAQTDINAGTTAYNPTLINEAKTTPTAVAGNEQKLNDFLKQWNASYTGPSTFENTTQYTDAAKAAQEANAKSEQLKTTGGREQLIQDTFNVYGQGNKGLDQALLESSSAFPTIQQQIQPQFASMKDYLASQSGNVNAAATKAAQDTAAAQTNTRNAFGTSLTDFQGNLNTETKAAQDTATALVNKYRDDLQSGNSAKVEADLTAAGTDPAQAKSIVSYLTALNKDYQTNPDLTNYYNYNPATSITPGTVATPQEYANAAALQKLTGTDFSGVLNQAELPMAGTQTADQITGQANKGFQTGNMADYLKGGLQQKDKELIFSANPINLKTLLPDFSDVKNASIILQKYFDAANRQGIKADKVTMGPAHQLQNLPGQMQTMYDQASNAVFSAAQAWAKNNPNESTKPGQEWWWKNMGTDSYPYDKFNMQGAGAIIKAMNSYSGKNDRAGTPTNPSMKFF